MPPKKKSNKDDNDILTRIAIVNADRSVKAGEHVHAHSSVLISLGLSPPHYRCKPKKCRQECKKSCPVVKIGQ